ncbi:5-dehydro-4-deoxyglucarate dehydratase [Actinokineospora sp. UTMC 2448]|uniref:5-dehydro-4-deoxyglucarate dehydratase n=1 Tax=Actinokineospora sp. UTMC 2448 TaxID=2268449 RepID=UPI0021647838|nr:5-dehydro-4-deoxyglucarate dehydratase [Actinokineospora sp. UTMC 2448]UVS78925.1 4-hydroxy-tetrahydrodipicolinate synthase [Actinokineospora sp. UTMC 2448]
MNLDGVLFFPVTPFDDHGVDVPALRAHIEHGLAHGPGAVFVACGTGEFGALDRAEHADAVRAAVSVVGGRAPVLTGAGGPLPHARACARQAADLGADGLLLMPPYLSRGPQAGLVSYALAVADASPLPLVLYQREPVRYTPESVGRLAEHPRVVGFKDGSGDLDLLHRIALTVRDKDFLLFNGLPTAEFSMPAYAGMGIPLYSSAAFAFVPEVATAFHTAFTEGDTERVRALLDAFYRPLVELRDRVPGYAVSLVKAGARLRGQPVGSVRAPLVDPSDADLAALSSIIDRGLAVARG